MRRSSGLSGPGEDGEEYPPWAIPGLVRPPPPAGSSYSRAYQEPGTAPRPEAEPGTGQGRGSALRTRHRAQAARARRTRRRTVLLGCLSAAAALIVALVLVLPGPHPGPARGAGFVTTYQPGEFRSVPDSCGSVPAAALARYLPGRRTMVALPSLPGNSGNQCNWTLDHRPVYRLLEVTAQAYAPSGLASGNGSATAAATDAYTQALASFRHPPHGTHQARAQVSPVLRLGDVAFSAVQVIRAGGDTTDRVTIVARFRNVLVTVQFSGLEHARQGGYGPVSARLLKAGAVTAAQGVLHRLS